jgi:hypothetical protein
VRLNSAVNQITGQKNIISTYKLKASKQISLSNDEDEIKPKKYKKLKVK